MFSYRLDVTNYIKNVCELSFFLEYIKDSLTFFENICFEIDPNLGVVVNSVPSNEPCSVCYNNHKDLTCKILESFINTHTVPDTHLLTVLTMRVKNNHF